ncbi:MAG: Carbon-monoxide dehydrogenase (acceptor) [Ilumatobacteraceae bacterium]|nr:Carbon-monoxide dehydrogenase (acceptor) [Ilumatobacteraceae bacterium]
MTIQRLTGSSVQRVEDPRILTGRGRYVDDVVVPGMLHAAFVRSPHAHARIVAIDTTAAIAMSGVRLVLTDAELSGVIGDLTANGSAGLYVPTYTALARDTVRLVGEPVAIVVADSRALAEDAVALVRVRYDVLDPVVDMDDAMRGDAAVLFPEHGSNVVYRTEHRYGDTRTAFAGAAHVVRERFLQHRHANVPMECRGGVADYSPATGVLEYTVSHQAPHAMRFQLSLILRQPAHLIRVRCGDIGGSFGQKGGIGREDIAVCAAARWLGRAVKWIEDRAENLMVAGQAREERLDVEAAIDADGHLLAVRVRMVMDTGAYPQLGFPASGYTNVVRSLFPGAYRLEHYDFDAIAVATNKGTYVPYRGPWEVETWVRERLFDVLARTAGIDPVEFRLRNLWRDEELPRQSVVGVELIKMSQHDTLLQARDRIGYDEFRREQAAAREHGRYLGIGFCNFIEPAPFMPSLIRAIGFMAAPRTPQEAHIRVEPDGTVTLFTSQQPHGQGHETTLAQLVADEIGVAIDRVRVVHGDTQVTPFNFVGTGGSRAATLASGAVMGAARQVRDRILRLAAELWEIDVADLDIVDGEVVAIGVPSRRLPMAMVGVLAYTRPGLANADGSLGIDEHHAYISDEGTWSQSSHCCIVEVDVETGHVRVLRFVVVEDCGKMINPAIVDGQVRGGVAQGISAVLFEHSAYGADGAYLADSLSTYLVATANDIPHIEVVHRDSSPDDPVPFRGVGEGGAIGAPAALTNAIEDALVPFGAKIREQHLPPHRILELIGVL